MQSPIQDLLGTLPRNALPFFVFFARFDYALKRAGYLKEGRQAEASWDKFAKDLGEPFLKAVDASGKARELLAEPPRKQVVKSGHLDWEPAKPIKEVVQLFVSIRRVRNNLFHGGKFPSLGTLCVAVPDRDDRDRGEQLINQAQKVLEMALEKCPKVKSAFCDYV
jgi:hypothetical protein